MAIYYATNLVMLRAVHAPPDPEHPEAFAEIATHGAIHHRYGISRSFAERLRDDLTRLLAREPMPKETA